MKVRSVLALCGVFSFALSAGAETIRIDDAPFPMPPIVVAEFPSRDFRIDDYGAKPDGSKCTDALAQAMEACAKSGGGRVVIPRGEWLTGAVRFRSNCNLFLEDGAILAFTDDPMDYPRVETTWEGVECLAHSPLLYAYACTNVAITGKGLVAPRMDRWKKWFGRPPAHQYATECLYHWCSTNAPLSARDVMAIPGSNVRPHLIQFNRCQNVLLDGFRIRESPFWMIHLYHSENCIVRNLETYAHGANNDGVDVDMTRNVLIENCKFDQGDDGICLKAGRNADAWRLGRPTENVVIRNCDLVKSHSLMGIGSELSGGIRNVWMTRCKVQTTGGLLRIKTNRRRGGFVENVWIDHCQGGVARWVLGIDTDVLFQWRNFPDYEIRHTRIRNLFMDEIDCEQAVNGFELLGDSRLPPENIEVKNVRIGRVTKAFKTVKNCRNVRFENVAEPKADPSFPWPYLEHFSNADRIAEKSPLYAKAVRFATRKDIATLVDGTYDLGDGVVATMGKEEFKPYQAAVYKTDFDHDTIVVLPDELSVERFLVGKYGTEFATWDQYIAVFPAGVTVASGLAVGHARMCRRLTISVPALWKVKTPYRPSAWAPTVQDDLEPVRYDRNGDIVEVAGGIPERERGWISERFTVNPGEWFHFIGRIATSNLQHSSSMAAVFFDAGGKQIGKKSLVSQWAKNFAPTRLHKIEQVPQDAAWCAIRAVMRGTGHVWFDQISYDTSVDDWQDQTDENRLLNASFEETDLGYGRLDAWEPEGDVVRSREAWHGSWSAKIGSGARLHYGARDARAIALRGGETVYVHMAHKGQVALWLILGSDRMERMFTSDDWQADEFAWTVPAGAECAALALVGGDGGALVDALHIGSKPYASSLKPAVMPVLPEPAKCVKMPRSEVRDFQGVPTWFVGDRPVVDSMYTFRAKPGQAAHGVRYHKRVMETGRFPIYVIGEHVNADEEGPESLSEFLEIIDHQVRVVMSSVPDAKFLVWYQQYPTTTFALDYPDELAKVEDTDQGFVKRIPGYSYGSEVWSLYCERSVKRFFEEMAKKPYADRIVGFMPGFGNFGENNYGHIDGRYYLSPHDFSPAMTTFFRKWLLREYGADARAFGAAWGRPGFNFAHAQVPTMLQRSPRLEGGFLDAKRQRQTIDYARCESFALLHRVDRQGWAAKAATDGRVFTASEIGYMYGRRYHRELMPMLTNKWIDAFGPAPGYTNRGAGDDIPAYAPVGSMKEHNKVYLFQADVRTHVEVLNPPDLGATSNASETVAVLLREMGKYMTDGEIPYHWTFAKWYDDPEIYKIVHEYERLMRFSSRFPRASRAEVALVVDPLSLSTGIQYAYGGTPTATAGHFMDLNRRLEWHKLGAMHDVWLLDDILKSDKLGQYKLVLLHGVCALTPVQAKLIRERLYQDGRTVVWMYAPPVFRKNGVELEYSLENARVAGFEFDEENGESLKPLIDVNGREFGWSKTLNYCGLGVPGRWNKPVPFPVVGFSALFDVKKADGIKPFGVWEASGNVAAAKTKVGNATSVFWGSVQMEREMLCAIAKEAGVHIYTDRPAVAYFNDSIGCIHVKEPGPIAIHLPRMAEEVIDLVDGGTLARNCTTFIRDMGEKTTVLFYFGERSRYDAAMKGVVGELADRDVRLMAERPKFQYDAVKTNLAARLGAGTLSKVDPAGFIRDWLFLGTFPSERFEGFEADFLGGEGAARPHVGDKVGDLVWQGCRFSSGRIRAIANELPLTSQNNHVYYLFTTVISDKDRQAILSVGSDDGEKTWLNGEVATQMNFQTGRSCEPDSEQALVTLKQGENVLLVKITQGVGNNGHAVRFLDSKTKRPIVDLKIKIE